MKYFNLDRDALSLLAVVVRHVLFSGCIQVELLVSETHTAGIPMSMGIWDGLAFGRVVPPP